VFIIIVNDSSLEVNQWSWY